MAYKLVRKVDNTPKWDQAVKDKHDGTVSINVWKAVLREKYLRRQGDNYNMGSEEEGK